MNELITHKSWWRKNRNWMLSVIILVIVAVGFIGSSRVGKNATHIAKAYLDVSLYENALALAQKNDVVQNELGKLELLDKLAILEGAVEYSANESVEMHIRIKGDKGKGKIDIFAFKKGTNWEYKKINIRIKKPKQTITVL